LNKQKGNQNPYIKEGQTTQWPNGQEEFEDTKGTNNDLQNIIIKLKIE